MTPSSNFFRDNEDLQFQFSQIDFESLFPLVETDSKHPEAPNNAQEAREQYRDMLDALGELIAKEIAPYTHELDHQKPKMLDGEMIDSPRMLSILKKLQEVEAFSLSMPRHIGGMNVPFTAAGILLEMLSRADATIMTYYSFFMGVGLALSFYSVDEGSIESKDGVLTKTRFDEQIRRIASGREWGAMVMTEPEAGSDLARINTKAVKQEDGNYKITGQKIWITCGHGEHHVVLARSEDTKTHPGMDGLSLFYVPAHMDKNGKRVRNIEIGGYDAKMGQNALATVTLNFDDSYGEMIGEPGKGFRGMLLLMNNARLIVGYEGLGLCESAFRIAKTYAADRKTMGKPIAQHEMIAEYLSDMELTICGLRALAYNASFNEEMASRIKLKCRIENKDESNQGELTKTLNQYRNFSRKSTPIVKYLAGEEAVRLTRMTMQILGGSGYMKEYRVEKLLRDALILPIYEGTSQIQALMALKDHLGFAMQNPVQFLKDSAKNRIAALNPSRSLKTSLAKLERNYFSAMSTIIKQIVFEKMGTMNWQQALKDRGAEFKNWDPKKDFSFGLWHAERFTKIAGEVAMAKVLVDQLHNILDKSKKPQRELLARRFIERAQSKTEGVLREIKNSPGSLLHQSLKRNSAAAA